MLTVRLLAPPRRLESLDDTCVDGREDEHRQNVFDDVQTFSVEFNRCLCGRSRPLGFEIVVNCTKRLDRMTLRGQVSEGNRRADSCLRVGRRGKPQLITGDEEVLHNFCRRPPSALSKSLNSIVIELMRGKGAGVCDNLSQTAASY